MSENPISRSGVKPIPEPGTLPHSIWNALKHNIAIIADIIGAIGIVALVLDFFEWMNKSSLLGVSAHIWAWTIGCNCLAG